MDDFQLIYRQEVIELNLPKIRFSSIKMFLGIPESSRFLLQNNIFEFTTRTHKFKRYFFLPKPVLDTSFKIYNIQIKLRFSIANLINMLKIPQIPHVLLRII